MPRKPGRKGKNKMKLADMFCGRSPLVIKEVEIDETAERQVKIVARKRGFVSFMLSLLRIDPTFTLCVYPDRVESIEGSLSGRMKTAMPSTSLDTYTCGEEKPLQHLFTGIVLLLLSWYFFNSLWMGLFMLGFFVLLYFIERNVALSVATKGSTKINLYFSKTHTDGVVVDEKLAERVCDIIRKNHDARMMSCKEKQ